MAIDEAILQAHINSLVPPTLRLYQFSPPAVSFGYAQNIDTDLRRKIQAAGYDIVRRPSGGRAVLHFGDLTYAFICSSKNALIAEYNLVSESITTAYKEICQALILLLNRLGLEVTFGNNKANYKDKRDCFLATTIGDLQYKGHKLVGSAQLRRKHGVLQHGSIILNQPQTLMYELIGGDKAIDNNTHHANLYEITIYKPSLLSLEQELVQSFEKTFNCRFLAKELTHYEQQLVEKLMPKYKNLIEVS